MAQPTANSHGHETFPWKHIIGYGLSLILTAIAFWLVLETNVGTYTKIGTILILAVFQMLVQLFMFMHLTERNHGPAFQTTAIYFGLFIAVTVILGSIWVMAFKSAVS
jgi:cytochrome aa3-600 menaquinol oxidase subunit IV